MNGGTGPQGCADGAPPPRPAGRSARRPAEESGSRARRREESPKPLYPLDTLSGAPLGIYRPWDHRLRKGLQMTCRPASRHLRGLRRARRAVRGSAEPRT
ncbi:hypothetical protein GCM10010495_49140 [Kitasatospora herbaricolor]|nr:hypothetical protein GCM10010495_49140 [Kitasatospora herbaricolor]